MAEVFSNDMVAHVWAQQRQQNGRSNNGNFYFEGRVLYSYGTHFPVGIFTAPGGPVFLNSDSYSVSTAKHKHAAWAAVRHIGERYSLPSLAAVQRLILSASRGRLPAEQRKAALAYLAEHWRSIPEDSDGAAWLLKAAASRGTWAAMRARLSAKADATAARNKARLKAQAATAGRELAARPWPLIRAEAWQAANSFGQRGLRETIKDCRESRLATPKAHKRVRSILWRYESGLRAILALAERDSDRHGNPGNRTKARALIGRLRRFKAGAIGHVPGYDGPDGMAKREAALELPTGAGRRILADMLRDISPLVHMPPAMREAGEALRAESDAIATEREGEEKQRQEIRFARSAVVRNLATFNRGRRAYRSASRADGTWAEMDNRARVRLLDSIISHVPAAVPWGQERGLELAPDLAARAAAIAARADVIAAELAPVRSGLLEAWERVQEAAREAERAERERVRNMSPDEKRTAWEAGELSRDFVRALERETGPLLRAVDPEIDGCRVTGGTLETSQGATVPLRHAFRVFQFTALCRAERKAWRAGGTWGPRHIRVGHFALDSVSPSGDFVAGCHAIQWREVERLAARLGVSDCLASLPELAAELAGEAA